MPQNRAPSLRRAILPIALGLLMFAVAFGFQAMFRGSCERFGFQFGVMLFSAVMSVGVLCLVYAALLLTNNPLASASTQVRAGLGALSLIALGIISAESLIVLDEVRFRREVAAAFTTSNNATTYSRARACPSDCRRCTTRWSGGTGRTIRRPDDEKGPTA